MVASLWSMPVSCSDLLPPSLAVMVWSSAVILPCETSGVPPWPRAFPRATIGSPTLTEDELAKLTVGRPDTLPSIWINALSALGSTPSRWAGEAPAEHEAGGRRQNRGDDDPRGDLMPDRVGYGRRWRPGRNRLSGERGAGGRQQRLVWRRPGWMLAGLVLDIRHLGSTSVNVWASCLCS